MMVMLMRNKFQEEIEDIKPHYNFSYAKGVLFNQDLHDLEHDELLKMCPPNVYEVFQVPKSNMIILTFHSELRPESIHIDGEHMWVRPFKPRPLQCFKCFGYGHASKVCERNQLCASCSYPKEQDHLCEPPLKCINCKEDHSARDRNCSAYKKEQAAVIKANDEHISVGYAKKFFLKRLSLMRWLE